MLNEKLASARRIRNHLIGSEEKLDTSIVEHAQLLIAIVETGRTHGLAAQDCAPAIGHAVKALSSLEQAREQTVACHVTLNGLRDAQGLDPRATGCVLTKLGSQAEVVHMNRSAA
jgi:fumarate hydratase class II